MIRRIRPAVVGISGDSGLGTGVIFDAVGQTAYILTNYHFLENNARLTVTVEDAYAYDASVVGFNAVRDLAVVSICCGNFTIATLGDAAAWRSVTKWLRWASP